MHKSIIEQQIGMRQCNKNKNEDENKTYANIFELSVKIHSNQLLFRNSKCISTFIIIIIQHKTSHRTCFRTPKTTTKPEKSSLSCFAF